MALPSIEVTITLDDVDGETDRSKPDVPPQEQPSPRPKKLPLQIQKEIKSRGNAAAGEAML